MINKKRLAMMAVAASMVLPNNLVYLATNTPVFAEEFVETGPITSTSTEENDPISLNEWLKTQTGDTFTLTEGSYYLEQSIEATELDKTIIISGTVAINLGNNNNISSSARDVFRVPQKASLEILGIGSIISSAPESQTKDKDSNGNSIDNNMGNIISLVGEESNLTLGPGITLSQNAPQITSSSYTMSRYVYGIALGAQNPNAATNTAINSRVNLTGTTIKTPGGISVNGHLGRENQTSEEKWPIINLTDVTINATTHPWDSIGIYQAGGSVINLVNSEVTSDICGVETRAGTLNISGFKGQGIKCTTTERLDIEANGNGSTSSYVGLAIAQHTTKLPVTVRVVKANISGPTAISIANPENNDDTDLKKMSIAISNSSLDTDVVYTTDKISFALVNNDNLTQNNVKKATTEIVNNKQKLKFTSDNKLSFEEVTNPQYVLVEKDPNSSNEATTNLEVAQTDLSEITLTPVEGSTTVFELNEEQSKAIADKLATSINGDNQAAFLKPYTSTQEQSDDLQPLKYDYEVTVGNKAVLLNGKYVFQVELKAKLDLDGKKSIVRLAIPYDPGKVKTNEPTPQLQTASLDNDGSFESNTYALDVQLDAVLDDSNKFSSSKIQGILNNIPEVAGKYNVADIDKFENLPALSAETLYSVVNTETPIIFEGVNKTPIISSGNHKPKPKPEEPMEEPVVGTPTPMYRLYNRLTGEHLYTIDKNERDNLLTSDTWKDEGEGWIAPSVSDYPVYRLLNPNNGDHHYTMDKNEFDTLPTYGWIAEGVAFFSADKDNPENVLLHRLYNPNAEGAGSHHYTADTNERDTLVSQGWKYEGLAWAGLPANK